jgi:hypothetical protein
MSKKTEKEKEAEFNKVMYGTTEPTAEEPTAEEPTAEEPTAEEPADGDGFKMIEDETLTIKPIKKIGDSFTGAYLGTCEELNVEGLEGLIFKNPETGRRFLISNFHHLNKFLERQRTDGVDFTKTLYKITLSEEQPMKGSDKPYKVFSFAYKPL